MNLRGKAQTTLRQANTLHTNNLSKRFFSYQQQPQGGVRVLPMLGVGLGTAGLMYLMYHSRDLSNQRLKAIAQSGHQQMNFFNPIVQKRIGQSLQYFGGGLGLTALTVAMFRNSSIAMMNPWLLFAVSIGTMFGTMMTDYNRSPLLKHAFWMTFVGSMGVSMIPLINMASMPVIFDALYATGFTMGGLGLIAYNAPSEEFLKWGGVLGMGCAGLLGVGLMSMFYPSPALYNIWLYGGLVLFSAFTLYDV